MNKSVLGHGADYAKVLAGKKTDPKKGDDALLAQNSAGLCVLGTTHLESSVHSIKVELSKMNTQKITMTLDCCRNVSRDAEAFVVYLK